MIKWYDKDISEEELCDKIASNLKCEGAVPTAEWLVKGIKDVALSKEEKTFKVTYRPFKVTHGPFMLVTTEGNTLVRFVKANDYVAAQDKILGSLTCEIVNVEEVK